MAKVGGQTGNKNAEKGRIWTEAVKRAIARRHGGLSKGLDRLADEFVNAVAEGGLQEFKELGDRLEGKSVQAIEGTGPKGEITVIVTSDDGGVL